MRMLSLPAEDLLGNEKYFSKKMEELIDELIENGSCLGDICGEDDEITNAFKKIEGYLGVDYSSRNMHHTITVKDGVSPITKGHHPFLFTRIFITGGKRWIPEENCWKSR